MSEDPFILRDEGGNPLGFVSNSESALLKLISFLYPNEPFEIHEMEENVVRKYFRELREAEE